MTETGWQESVVLVHGLWMPGWEMALLRRRLERCGFSTFQFRYPTIRRDLAHNAARLERFLQQVPGDIVHFVAHSMGGLVVRRLLLDRPYLRPGRVVTIGTPHRGSRVADSLSRNAVGRLLLGRSAPALLGQLPHWGGERTMGSIAGDLPLGLGQFFSALPPPHDGTVAVDETRTGGLADALLVNSSHFGMLISAEVARQTCTFLRDGRFLR